FHFDARYVDRMPDEVVQDVIAHELAHGLQSAYGIRCNRKYKDGRAEYITKDGHFFGGNYELEEDVDFRIWQWGFDPASVERWARGAGLVRVVNEDDPLKA